MPKRMISGGGFGADLLPGWQATGLALAAVGSHVLNGSGVLAFALLSVGVIWVLHRLRESAPESRTTADLIGSVLGPAPARGVSVIQYIAYILLAAYTARNVGLLSLTWTADPVAASSGWLWPASAMAAAGVAGMLVAWLPTKILAPVVTAMATIGLLVYFYVALAVLAKIYSGTAPVEDLTSPTSSAWGAIGILIPLALALVGFEIPTTASDRLRSVARPLGWAMTLVALSAATMWAAANVGTSGVVRYDAEGLIWVVSQMFPDSTGLLMLIASVALSLAALLVLMWGATRIAPPPIPGEAPGVLLVTAATAVLAIAMCRGWGDVSAKLWGVAGILLLIVYLLAAQAYSRLDDGSTAAWALFAFTGIVVGVVVFMTGTADSWWPVGIAAAIAALAVAIAAKSRQSTSVEDGRPAAPRAAEPE